MNQALASIHSGYRLLRAEGNEDAAAVASVIDLASEGDWDSRLSLISGATPIHINPNDQNESRANKACIAICGGEAANKAFEWILYLWQRFGPAEFTANGTGILGTQAVVKYPHNLNLAAANKFWADTLVVSNERWQNAVLSTDEDGNNEVAKLVLDLYGYEYFLLGIAAASGSGSEAGDITGYWSFV